jgi:signal transduction histidine kinase
VLREARFDLHVSTMKRGLAEAILRQHPDLVLLVSSGPAALKLCQQIKKHDDSPLVVVVLNESPPANWTGFTAGVDDFVVRPLNPKELVARLSMSLRSSRQRTRLVSDNRGLEAQLAERNRDLERALLRAREVTVLKDSIVSTVSHEMRTPLLQVKSSLAMLAEDLKQSPESTTRLLNYASQAVARLESTVNNITQLAASLNLRREPFSVTDAVNQAIRQLRRMWESSHGIDRIRPLLPDDLPLAVGDRGGTAQVLQQLIDNALKFSPDGGPVEVIAEVVEDGLRLTVRDHGIGIQADQMDKIFQAFYQVDGSSTRHFGGAGIGLAIAKLILDGMETSIDAFSQVGEGSAFSFVLPSHTGES